MSDRISTWYACSRCGKPTNYRTPCGCSRRATLHDDDPRPYLIPAPADRGAELRHEYEVCVECRCTGGQHFDGCKAID